jgi:hypothetical protein
MTLMKKALDETKLPAAPAHVLEMFLDATATAMMNKL